MDAELSSWPRNSCREEPARAILHDCGSSKIDHRLLAEAVIWHAQEELLRGVTRSYDARYDHKTGELMKRVLRIHCATVRRFVTGPQIQSSGNIQQATSRGVLTIFPIQRRKACVHLATALCIKQPYARPASKPMATEVAKAIVCLYFARDEERE
jgi:hypothetical protein